MRHQPDILVRRNEIVSPPTLSLPRACDDRTFEFPTALYLAMAALFLGFVGVLSLAFSNAEMALPFAVFVTFIAAFFVVPSLWVRMAPDKNSSKALSWSEFMGKDVDTAAGPCSGREAAVLVLLLPAVIFGWAIAIAAVAALG
jgi:hypothetical protein